MNEIKQIYKDAYADQSCISGLDARLLLAAEELESDTKVLEIGLGSGTFSKGIKSHNNIELYGVDISQSAIDSCQDYLKEGIVRDLSTELLPWENDYFDSVVCLEVFEHLQNPYRALLEIQRVLKPGGKLILSVPNSRGGHLMVYPGFEKPKNISQFLMQNYFYVEKIKPYGLLLHKDNIGQYISDKYKSLSGGQFVSFIAATSLRILQIIFSVMKLKGYWTYWCYTFVSVNRKAEMDAPLWQKQIEQTTAQKKYHGWYHPYYHKTPSK